ncbi:MULTISPECIES: preprotein translocase subunit YajC [unclassified Nocardioides]|uniref:preprotein translocase subunit YajC n=1 Tax=Nocardioides sp. URHA0032 TaxID=1380388 RepID=UPI00048F8C56|nr:preprotein translocase subunit YajC [Nocardioides sp. URHA0032]
MLELLPLVGIALLFWLFIIRPASRRQKELGRMQSSLDVGDEVVLTSGIFGTVRELHDDRVEVEVADGVVIEVARGAIGTIATRADEPADEPVENDETGTVAGPEEN